MKDWKRIAQASGAGIPADSLAAIAASLEALEKVTQPLYDALTPDVEPTTRFEMEASE